MILAEGGISTEKFWILTSTEGRRNQKNQMRPMNKGKKNEW